MVFSRTFEKQVKTEISLESLSFLNKEKTLAIFSSSKKSPFCNETLNI